MIRAATLFIYSERRIHTPICSPRATLKLQQEHASQERPLSRNTYVNVADDYQSIDLA